MRAAGCCGLVNVMIERNKGAARPVDVVAGNLQIRLAESEAEVVAAQALRYRVFYEGMGATPSAEVADKQRDFDRFDDYCDHLLVLDQAESGSEPAVVGTYRVMRREAASRSGRFYSSDEYDIGPLKAVPGEIMLEILRWGSSAQIYLANKERLSSHRLRACHTPAASMM